MKDYTQVERDNAALTIREYAFGQMNMLRMLDDDDAANNLQEAINVAIAALRGPQPDPDTGLVRCGCGGKAEIRKWEWSNDSYIAGCTVCDANVDFPYDIDETDKIISDWNRAMGRRTEK